MRSLVRGSILTVAVALFTLPGAALAAPATTVERTILDCDGDNLLDLAFGERHVIFPGTPEQQEQKPCEERPDGEELRLPPSASIINFLQLSDFQMVDEESPGRVEFLDGTQRVRGAQPFSAAYRPQESLTTQTTEAMVRQARNAVSPVTGRKLDMAILTGDNADSQQYNETRWFVDILDGTDGSGNPDPEAEPPDERGSDRKIHPDSGIPSDAPGCDATPGTRYDGVRNSGQRPVGGVPRFDGGYYDPDTSNDPRADGDGYLPDRGENATETGQDVTVRDFPGLLERAQDPFEAVGLDLPWYSAFGNHDALIQGNSPQAYAGPLGPSGEQVELLIHAYVTGCLKVKQPVPPETFGTLPDQIAELLQQDPPNETLLEQLSGQLQDRIDQVREESSVDVPGDPRRCYLAKDDGNTVHAPGPCLTGSWIAQHFRTTGTPVGHGFAPSDPAACAIYQDQAEAACRAAAADVGPGLGRPPQAIANHDGYYSFVPKPGLRFVVLDTVTDECGSLFCSEGTVDKTQFQWLREQIEEAAKPAVDQYVVVFSHHTLRTIRFVSVDPEEQPVHYGQEFDRRSPGNPQNQSPVDTLEELYCKHPNVIGHVAGHEHENYVEPHECGDDEPPTHCEPEPCANDLFWQISTAAHIDYPQQARMIELVNRDGELTFVLTILDHDGPANPGGPRPPHQESGQEGDSVLRLAATAREIAYNDYQGSRGARGGRQDRNVILPTRRPPPGTAPSP